MHGMDDVAMSVKYAKMSPEPTLIAIESHGYTGTSWSEDAILSVESWANAMQSAGVFPVTARGWDAPQSSNSRPVSSMTSIVAIAGWGEG